MNAAKRRLLLNLGETENVPKNEEQVVKGETRPACEDGTGEQFEEDHGRSKQNEDEEYPVYFMDLLFEMVPKKEWVEFKNMPMGMF
jgi:hypothetical protein